MPDANCVDSVGADSVFRLNASSLSDPSALIIDLYSDSVSGPFKALIDCGSSHCFVDSEFVELRGLWTINVPLITLCLFDGTSNQVII